MDQTKKVSVLAVCKRTCPARYHRPARWSVQPQRLGRPVLTRMMDRIRVVDDVAEAGQASRLAGLLTTKSCWSADPGRQAAGIAGIVASIYQAKMISCLLFYPRRNRIRHGSNTSSHGIDHTASVRPSPPSIPFHPFHFSPSFAQLSASQSPAVGPVLAQNPNHHPSTFCGYPTNSGLMGSVQLDS